jgi:Mg2+/citrate symporter
MDDAVTRLHLGCTMHSISIEGRQHMDGQRRTRWMLLIHAVLAVYIRLIRPFTRRMLSLTAASCTNIARWQRPSVYTMLTGIRVWC